MPSEVRCPAAIRVPRARQPLRRVGAPIRNRVLACDSPTATVRLDGAAHDDDAPIGTQKALCAVAVPDERDGSPATRARPRELHGAGDLKRLT